MSGYQQGPGDGRAWQDRDPYREREQQEQQERQRLQRQQQAWPPQPPPAGPVVPYPQPYPQQPRPVLFVPAKTPGLAVLFSFLWLGAGNCYAGQVGLGVALIITQVVCAPISALLASVTLGFSLVVTVPLWIAAFVVSAVTGYHRCQEHNRALGLYR